MKRRIITQRALAAEGPKTSRPEGGTAAPGAPAYRPRPIDDFTAADLRSMCEDAGIGRRRRNKGALYHDLVAMEWGGLQ